MQTLGAISIENSIQKRVLSDYKVLLEEYRLSYNSDSHYHIIGNISTKNGWCLYLSLIKMQIDDSFRLIIPILIDHNVPFKIIKNIYIANDLLLGKLGHSEIGKILCIYPESDTCAVVLAQTLCNLTKNFKGPVIPDSFHLGGIVYTKFDSFSRSNSPNIANGLDKYCCAEEEQLSPENEGISFRLTYSAPWPFSSITEVSLKRTPKLLNAAYRPISVLKTDVKGRVIKALYFKKPWLIHPCVIKEGLKHMFCDMSGRDIRDRLAWQSEIYTRLGNTLPVPKIFDYFLYDGNAYLVMEYIKGKPLSEYLTQIYIDTSWIDLSAKDQMDLLNKLLEIIRIISTLHQLGYVHRDITPVNFIVDKSGKVWMIDLELCYSMKDDKPNPPFALGSHGYMSPEQIDISTPTTKEDIYGLGGLLIDFFTHLPSIKFSKRNHEYLKENLTFFIGDVSIAMLIVQCLNNEPFKRPKVEHISQCISKASRNLSRVMTTNPSNKIQLLSTQTALIQHAINGFSLSKFPKEIGTPNGSIYQEIHTKGDIKLNFKGGLMSGVGGLIYTFALANKCGYDLSKTSNILDLCLEYLYNEPVEITGRLEAGFHFGGAGLMLAFVEGLNSELIQYTDTVRLLLNNYLVQETALLNFSTGISGKGFALLKSTIEQKENWVDSRRSKILIQKYSSYLLEQQQANGSWNINTEIINKLEHPLYWSKGLAGILFFLLGIERFYPSRTINISVRKGLKLLTKHFSQKSLLSSLFESNKSKKLNHWSFNNGLPGIILLFLNAFKVLGDVEYKDLALQLMEKHPKHSVWADFSLARGLAGRGGIYLAANRILGESNSLDKISWIAETFKHSFNPKSEDTGYWITTNETEPIGSFWNGNLGILDFLMQFEHPQIHDNIFDIKDSK